MVANVCMVLETLAFTESDRQGTNILVVKGTAHTGMKDIIMCKSHGDNFGIGQFKKSLKKNWKKDEQFESSATDRL